MCSDSVTWFLVPLIKTLDSSFERHVNLFSHIRAARQRPTIIGWGVVAATRKFQIIGWGSHNLGTRRIQACMRRKLHRHVMNRRSSVMKGEWAGASLNHN